MYLPKHFANDNEAQLLELMKKHPFASLVTAINAEPQINHLPFYLDAKSRTLQAHIPKVNPLYSSLKKQQANQQKVGCLVAFMGPQAYITPSWYPSKKETGKVVPTWNYAVVHVRGTLCLQEETHWLEGHLDALTNQQEPTRDSTWKMSDAPTEYTTSMMQVLCGLEIAIEHMVGKFKLSQNRLEEDQEGVQNNLSNSSNEQDIQIAHWMMSNHPLK